MRVGVLLEDLKIRVVLAAQLEDNASTLSTRLTFTSSLRQNAQIDFGLACLTGVPFGLMAMRVPAASAFLWSFLMRSFLVIGILAVVDRDVSALLWKFRYCGYLSAVEIGTRLACRGA